MLEQLSKTNSQLSDLVNQMVQPSKNKRLNCKEVYDHLIEIKKMIEKKVDIQFGRNQSNNKIILLIGLSNLLYLNRLMKTTFLKINLEKQINKFKLIKFNNFQKAQPIVIIAKQFVQSGIKLDENLRNQIKQWQVKKKQSQSQQDEAKNHLESSDEMEQNFYDQMTFAQLLEILNRFPLIKQISESDLLINDEYNIDEQQNIFRCTLQKQEKVVKIYKNKPASHINNINHIQKLKIYGLLRIRKWELFRNSLSYNLIMNCDLERALAIPQIQQKQLKLQVIFNMSLFLKAYNEHFTHGNLKPSNILVENKLNIYVTDYRLSEVKGEIDQQLYSSKPSYIYVCIHLQKKQQRIYYQTNQMFDILTGQKMNNQTILKLGMKDHFQQGYLNIDKLNFFPSTEQNIKMKSYQINDIIKFSKENYKQLSLQ